ncbi:MAG TPA: fumarylacetoacetate hydrolase family protein [Pseudonocardiaceae bacterium]|jgi:2-keto-4-pentenoate hydratase/2-oxohepta-3-ene-1,7-dioic acid hydratase in catechol pathway|nr:fumarylacetoacetate hydrolase family protein [Pseudonocardiaceae bacterium]
MRLGVIANRLVLVDGESAIDVERASNRRFGADPAHMFDAWDQLVDWAASTEPDGERLYVDLLQNPVPAPRQVFAVGANYRDHVAEAAKGSGHTGDIGALLPTAPLIFTKFPACLAGPYDAIPLPSTNVDWEAELVVVMGRRAERVSEKDAWQHVAALTVGQDISERVLQMAGAAPQFSMSKSFPGFGPMGPVLVTPDALDDPDDLEIGCTLNGRVMQKGRTSDMVFSVAELVARISAVCPLLPGDVIFTGTPAGVGAFRNPPLFLKPGDSLVTWVKGIGDLHNSVTAGHGYIDDNTLGDKS